MKIKTVKLLCAASLSLLLAACGGGSGSALDDQADLINRSSSNSAAVSSAIGSDTLQAIEFVDATPSVIALQGIGGTESSLVRFRVVGKTGQPIKGINVDFTLNSVVGGLTLSQNSGTSSTDGYVSTSVISGRVATSVKVTATVTTDTNISAQSKLLVVATGLPDQKSMSLAASRFNPPGWNYNGTESNISVLLADAYNNPVADGTAISFTTEGGSIVSSCTTLAGGCAVTWTSQDPRPLRNSSDYSTNRILCLDVPDQDACEAERAGRITILATAIGNESFKNIDGTGIYDVADIFKTSKDGGNCTANVPLSSHESSIGACDDLAEAYLDTNESGTHEPGEFFVNFITDKTDDLADDNYTSGNNLYNGDFCQVADEKEKRCSRSSITIRKDLLLVMSCDYPYTGANGTLPRVVANANIFALADCNGNALPVGTTVTVGTADPFILGSGINWRSISAAPNTLVKLEIPIKLGDDDEITKKISVYTDN